MGTHRADSTAEPTADDPGDPSPDSHADSTADSPADSIMHDNPGLVDSRVATPETGGTDTRLPNTTPRKRAISLAMLAVGAFILLGGLWTGWRTYQAYSHLNTARSIVADMNAHVQASGIDDLPGLVDKADELAAQTSAAHSAVNDPIYRLASYIPVLGDNLGAVRDVAVSMDGIAEAAQTGLPALTTLTDHASWASGGHFDLDVLQPAANAVIHLNDAVQSAISTVTSNDRGSLVGPVNAALNEYGTELVKLSRVTQPGAQAAQVVMPILGADGPRTYLIAFQNLAEARPTGGIFGFYATLHVQDGTLTLGPAGSSDRDFGYFKDPVIDINPAYEQLYWPGMARFPQDVNFSPDYPTAASSFSAMYKIHTGQQVDGVIAVDPVVVSVLMRGLAPIDVGEGLSLSSDTAVHTLLAGIYDVFPGGARLAQRDALMKRAVGAAFTAVLANVGNLEPSALIDDVGTLLDERRILVWSADDAEESVLLTTQLGGRQGADTEGRPTAGIFIVDGNGGKMSYYLRASAKLGAAVCAPGGAATAPLTITIDDTSPMSGLPPYVASGAGGTGNYLLRTNLILMAPTDGDIGDVFVNGKQVPRRIGIDHGRAVSVFSLSTRPGETATVTVNITMGTAAQGGAGTRVTPELFTTPMAYPFTVSTEPFTQCGGIPTKE